MRKVFFYLFIIISLLNSFELRGQEAKDSINTSLEIYYQELLKSRITEFNIKIPPIYLSLIPSIGTTAIIRFDGSVRIAPRISFNISQFISLKKEQNKRASKIRAIKAKTEIEKNDQIRKIEKEEKKIKYLKQEYEVKKRVFQIKKKIFEYDSLKYLNHEINPDEYYRSKIEMILEENKLKNIIWKMKIINDEINYLLKK